MTHTYKPEKPLKSRKKVVRSQKYEPDPFGSRRENCGAEGLNCNETGIIKPLPGMYQGDPDQMFRLPT